jgi:hypothetical protein
VFERAEKREVEEIEILQKCYNFVKNILQEEKVLTIAQKR